ncbi:MAG: hypothetical protein WC348_00575 [Patescibacteria group bacterium]|jgi:hypothetical protein
MFKKFLILTAAFALVLAGAGCGEEKTPAAENENQNANVITANVNGSVVELVEPQEEEETGEMAFVEFVNKTMGYKIVRPDGWYWQHLIQREIGETMPEVDDLFVTDPNPLPPLGTGYLGRIVIEVSRRSLTDLERNLSDLTSRTVTVGGISATKYEGVRSNEMVENQKYITYLFQKDSKTYRIAYTMKDSTTEDEAVFTRVVESLSF